MGEGTTVFVVVGVGLLISTLPGQSRLTAGGHNVMIALPKDKMTGALHLRAVRMMVPATCSAMQA